MDSSIHIEYVRSERATLETRRGPIIQLDCSPRLDGSSGGLRTLMDSLVSVPEAARHVLSVTGITLHRHRCTLEDMHGDLSSR